MARFVFHSVWIPAVLSAHLAGGVIQTRVLGGAGADRASAVALNRAGDIWVTGSTASPDFPVRNPAQARFGGGPSDAFVARLNRQGDVVWATWIGGSGADEASRVEIDSQGNAWVAGVTRSSDFPATADALQRGLRGPSDAFLVKLSLEGQVLYATLFGGDGEDSGRALLLDREGVLALGGDTTSPTLPAASGALFPARRGASDGFVAVFDATGRRLDYASYLGGTGDDTLAGMALGQSGALYLTGQTASPDFPTTAGAAQRTLSGPSDAYLIRLSPARDRIEFASYLGGSGADAGTDVVVDLSEMVYVGGTTASPNFPVVPAGTTSFHGGATDAFFTQFSFDRGTAAGPVPAALGFGASLPRALGLLRMAPAAGGREGGVVPSDAAATLVASALFGGGGATTATRISLTSAIFFKVLIQGEQVRWTDTIGGITACVSPGSGGGFATIGQNNPPASVYLRCWGAAFQAGDLATSSTREVVVGSEASNAVIRIADFDPAPEATLSLPVDQYSAPGNNGQTDDPIATATGELFDDELDLALGGPLPLSFIRHYGSNLAPNRLVRSALGPNWMHNFDVAMLFNQARTQALVLLFRARAATFTLAGNNWTPQFGMPVDYQLSFDGQFYRFFDPSDRLIYTFFNTGQLGRIDDLNGNWLIVTQGTNGPTRVRDDLGRTLDFTYTGALLTRVTDQSGRSVEFSYTGGDLASAVLPGGARTTYQYTTAGTRTTLLTRRTLPEGNTPFVQEYDARGRTVRQTNSRGHGLQLAYETPDPRYVRITDPLGAATLHRSTNFNILTEVIDPEGGVTSFEYDFSGRRTGVRDREGRVSSAVYGPRGALARATEADGAATHITHVELRFNAFAFHLPATATRPDGTTHRFAYDTRGNLTSFTDAAGQTWTYSYTARGWPASFRVPSGATATAEYNSDGTLASVRRLTGETVRFEYDALKRPVRITRGDGSTVSAVYDGADRVTSVTDSRGQTTAYSYDANGRLIARRDAMQAQVRAGYDGDNRRTTITDALGGTIRLGYDAVGRLLNTTGATGVERRLTYDRRGYVTAVSDGTGTLASFTHDAEGAPLALTNGAGQTWRMERDARRRPVVLTDPAGNRYRFAWSPTSRLTEQTNPLGHSRRFQFDAAGRLQQIVHPEGETVRLSYNTDSGVSQVIDPRGNAWSADRDGAGRVVARRDPTGLLTRFEYNARGRLAKITHPDNSTASFTYDPNGRLVREDYSDGTQVTYTRDHLGRVTQANGVTLAYDAAGRVTESNGIRNEYDAAGRIVAIHYSADRAVRYTYNGRGLLSRVTDWAGRNWEYEYDAALRPVRCRAPNGVVSTYAYDAAGRLSAVSHRGGNVDLDFGLERDAAGRLVQVTGPVPVPPLNASAKELAYLANHRIQGREYDGRGNTTRDGDRRFTWDGRNRLRRVTAPGADVAIEYDAFGSPIRVGGTAYVWNYATNPPLLIRATAASAGAGASLRLSGEGQLGIGGENLFGPSALGERSYYFPARYVLWGGLIGFEPDLIGSYPSDSPGGFATMHGAPGARFQVDATATVAGTSSITPGGEAAGLGPFSVGGMLWLDDGSPGVVIEAASVALATGQRAVDMESASRLDTDSVLRWAMPDGSARWKRLEEMSANISTQGFFEDYAVFGYDSDPQEYERIKRTGLGPSRAEFQRMLDQGRAEEKALATSPPPSPVPNLVLQFGGEAGFPVITDQLLWLGAIPADVSTTGATGLLATADPQSIPSKPVAESNFGQPAGGVSSSAVQRLDEAATSVPGMNDAQWRSFVMEQSCAFRAGPLGAVFAMLAEERCAESRAKSVTAPAGIPGPNVFRFSSGAHN